MEVLDRIIMGFEPISQDIFVVKGTALIKGCCGKLTSYILAGKRLLIWQLRNVDRVRLLVKLECIEPEKLDEYFGGTKHIIPSHILALIRESLYRQITYIHGTASFLRIFQETVLGKGFDNLFLVEELHTLDID